LIDCQLAVNKNDGSSHVNLKKNIEEKNTQKRVAFCALTLLVGRQEEHLACKIE